MKKLFLFLTLSLSAFSQTKVDYNTQIKNLPQVTPQSFGAKCDGTTLDDTAFATIAGLTANTAVIFHSSDICVLSVNQTFPVNIFFDLTSGGKWAFSGSPIVNYNSPLLGDRVTMFVPGFTASLTLNSVTNPVLFPQWFGALGNGSNDDTAAINLALSFPNRLVDFGCGTFVTSALIHTTQNNIRVTGGRGCTIIQPKSGFPAATDVFDLDNHSNIEVDNITLDGQHLFWPGNFGSMITCGPNSGSYSGINIHDNLIINTQFLSIGCGTNGGTATGTIIKNNYINLSTCVTASCGNGIDIGALGTRQNIIISGNTIIYPSGVTGVGTINAGGTCIFAGHGVTKSVSIVNNTCLNPRNDGIQIYARAFNGTDTPLNATNYTVIGNTINNGASAGISCFGCTNTTISGNSIYDVAGDATAAGYTPVGINITDGLTTAGTYFAAKNVIINSNSIIDDRGSHLMTEGIGFVANTTGSAPNAVATGNVIDGALTIDIGLNTNTTNSTVTTQRFPEGTNGQTPVTLNIPFTSNGNISAIDGINGIGTTIMYVAGSTNNFRSGIGINCFWNVATGLWNFVGDGTNNGGSCILGTSSAGFNIYYVPTTGGTTQTMSDTTLQTHLLLHIAPSGTIVQPPGGMSTTQVNPLLQWPGTTATDSTGYQSIFFTGLGANTGAGTYNEQLGMGDTSWEAGFGSFLGSSIAHPVTWGYSSDGVGMIMEFVAKRFQAPILTSDRKSFISLNGYYNGGVQLNNVEFTVSTLPTCNSSNRDLLLAVRDATAPTYNGALTGGGTVIVPVFCNGTSWTSH